jgi:hypothetical protein
MYNILRNGKIVDISKYGYLLHLLDSINSLQYEFENIKIEEGELSEDELMEINSLVQQLDGVSEK